MHLLCNIIVRNKQIVEFISVKSEQNLSIQAEKKIHKTKTLTG